MLNTGHQVNWVAFIYLKFLCLWCKKHSKVFGNTSNYIFYCEAHQKIEFETQFLHAFVIEFHKTLFVFVFQKRF